MKLKILSFSGESFSNNNVVSITLKTKVWEATILDNHAPMIASIKPSVLFIKFKDENGVEHRDDFAVGAWVVEVKDSEVKVMADMLVDIEEVDYDEAEKARLRALELMQKYKHSKDRVDMEKFIEAEDMLLKSIAQLKLYDLK